VKLKPTTLIYILLLCSSSLLLKAQEPLPGQPNDLDKIYVPDKGSIFSSDAKKDDKSSYSVGDVKHIIKLNLTMFPRSIAAVYYERRFTDQVALQGGLGLTFDKDRIMGATSGIADDFSNNESAIKLSEMMEYGVSNGNGLFASLSFRLNWDSYYYWDVIPYFEVNTRYYSNKLNINKLEYGTIDGSASVKIKNISYNLIYGVEFLTEGKIRTAHDFYMGIGLRNTSYDKFTSVQSQNSTGPDYPIYTKTSQRTKSYAPMFIMGYALGIGF
jgi:hypothetical protein